MRKQIINIIQCKQKVALVEIMVWMFEENE